VTVFCVVAYAHSHKVKQATELLGSGFIDFRKEFRHRHLW